jgi:hypothetical protein
LKFFPHIQKRALHSNRSGNGDARNPNVPNWNPDFKSKVILGDPKMYTKPWHALNKFTLRLQPEWFDIREQVCSASEAADYNKTVAAEAAAEKKE